MAAGAPDSTWTPNDGTQEADLQWCAHAYTVTIPTGTTIDANSLEFGNTGQRKDHRRDNPYCQSDELRRDEHVAAARRSVFKLSNRSSAAPTLWFILALVPRGLI